MQRINLEAPTPTVSVVIPSFNVRPEIMLQSLESIRIQSLSDFECIVVDESTQPELAKVCSDFCALDRRFFYIKPSKRLGLPASLNLGMSHARGRYIARADADDVCVPNRLELQARFLDDNPDVSVLGGALTIIDSNGNILAHRSYPAEPKLVEKSMHFSTSIAHPTVMFRRLAVENFGGYDSSFRYAEDLDLWLRWLNFGLRFANLPAVLVSYRQDSTLRDSLHWKYNLKARTKNFGKNYFMRRAIGITCTALWSVLPGRFQNIIFKKLIFRS